MEKDKKIILFFCDGQKDLKNTFNQFKEKNKNKKINDINFTIINENILHFINIESHSLYGSGTFDDYVITDKAMESKSEKFILYRKINNMKNKTSFGQ